MLFAVDDNRCDYDPLFFPEQLSDSLPYYRLQKEKKASYLRPIYIIGLILIILLALSYCPFFQGLFKTEESGLSEAWRPDPDYSSDENWTFFAPTKSFYRTLYGSYNFTQCTSMCKVLMSQLTSVHSHEENEFIFNLTKTGKMIGDHANNTWIGIHRLKDNSSIWKNIDGTAVDFYNWDNYEEGEPNNNGGHENCVEIYTDKSCPRGECRAKWNDLNCDFKMRACVCKRPGYWLAN